MSGFERLSAFFHESANTQHFEGGQGDSHFRRHFRNALASAGVSLMLLSSASADDSSRNLIDTDLHQEILDSTNQRLMQSTRVGNDILVVLPDQPVEVMKNDICPAVPIPTELSRWDATRALTGLERSIRISYVAEDIHRYAADVSAGACIADVLLANDPDAEWSRDQFASVFAGLNQIATGAPDNMIRELAGFYTEAESKKEYPDRLKSPGLDIVARDMRSLKRELAGADIDQIIDKTMEILPMQAASIEARFEREFSRLQDTFKSLAELYTDMDIEDMDAIRRASRDSDVDFAELMTKIAIESAFDEEAEAARSSATGLGQHIDQTWLAAVYLFGNQFGMEDAVRDITRHKNRNGAYIYSVADDEREQEILDLRSDRYYSAALTGALMQENDALLRNRLGRNANATDRYIAHMMGPNDAVTLIRAATQGDPRSSYNLFRQHNNPARNNPRFFKRNGHYLTAGQVYNNIERFIDGRLRQFKQIENSPVSDRDLFSRVNGNAGKPSPG